MKETHGGNTETYIGLTGNTFKNRYYKHKKSFNTQGYQSTTLSSHIWNMKRRAINYELSWRIVSKARSYSPIKKTCDLCTREIYFIMFEKHQSSLNNRNELFTHCLHKDKYLLKNQWKTFIPVNSRKPSRNLKVNLHQYAYISCLVPYCVGA